MAHEFESGFFVRQPAWHKLGNVLADAPNPLEALCESGLDWQVSKHPLTALIGGNVIETDAIGVFRNTDNRFYGVCKDGYEIFQNFQAFEWTAPFIESGFYKYEAAGALKSGAVNWILLRQGDMTIATNDTINTYLLMVWSHDGSKAITIMPTSIRVVCNNTLTAALKATGKRDKVKHTSALRPKMDYVQKCYLESTQAFANQKTVFQMMMDVKVDDGFNDEFAFGILNTTAAEVKEMKEGRGLTSVIKNHDIIMDAIKNGSGLDNPEVKGTLYASFQGATEAVEHFIGGNRVKDRGLNILFGSGAEMSDRAFELAVQKLPERYQQMVIA